LRKAAPLHCG